MQTRVFRNLSRKNDRFLLVFWADNLIVLAVLFWSILEIELITEWFNSFLLGLTLLALVNAIRFTINYFSGYIVDDEGITKFTIKGKKKHRSWEGVIKVGTLSEEIHKNNFPSKHAIKGGVLFNTTQIYLSPFFPRDAGEYLLTHPDVFIFSYREDLYNLVAEKVKQHNPETKSTHIL